MEIDQFDQKKLSPISGIDYDFDHDRIIVSEINDGGCVTLIKDQKLNRSQWRLLKE